MNAVRIYGSAGNQAFHPLGNDSTNFTILLILNNKTFNFS